MYIVLIATWMHCQQFMLVRVVGKCLQVLSTYYSSHITHNIIAKTSRKYFRTEQLFTVKKTSSATQDDENILILNFFT